MKLSVDHIVENYAICENLSNEKITNIPLSCLPNGIKEGDILIKNSEDGTFHIDKQETELRRNKMINLQNKIFSKHCKRESDSHF